MKLTKREKWIAERAFERGNDLSKLYIPNYVLVNLGTEAPPPEVKTCEWVLTLDGYQAPCSDNLRGWVIPAKFCEDCGGLIIEVKE